MQSLWEPYTDSWDTGTVALLCGRAYDLANKAESGLNRNSGRKGRAARPYGSERDISNVIVGQLHRNNTHI